MIVSLGEKGILIKEYFFSESIQLLIRFCDENCVGNYLEWRGKTISKFSFGKSCQMEIFFGNNFMKLTCCF